MDFRTSRDFCIFFAFTNLFFLFWNNSLLNGIICVTMVASALLMDSQIKKGS